MFDQDLPLARAIMIEQAQATFAEYGKGWLFVNKGRLGVQAAQDYLKPILVRLQRDLADTYTAEIQRLLDEAGFKS